MDQPLRVLFLHPNFPGQFRHPAQDLAADGHQVRFLCQTHYGRTLKGVERLCLKGELGHGALNERGQNQFERSQLQAEQFRRGLLQLQGQGWVPDVVISHSGWGCGLHVKELWPRCRHVAYVEWWFDPASPLLSYDPGNAELGIAPGRSSKLWKRNQAMALELCSADVVVAPTRWQRQQLPPLLQAACEVVPDGVDTNVFRPNPARRSAQPLLTYGTRGMEPMRAFPQFIRELPELLRRHPALRVEIAGRDEINYGGAKPAQGSWGAWAREHLAEAGVRTRVHWLDYLAGERYVQWLQSSWCHVYLTHPFVASWSLVEALACGCPLVASDVGPVREFCAGGAARLVDHREPGFLLQPVTELLATKPSAGIEITGISRERARQRWRDVAGVKVATSA